MLEQLHSLTQSISHADLSVQNIGNCDYVLDAPYTRYYRFRFADGFYGLFRVECGWRRLGLLR